MEPIPAKYFIQVLKGQKAKRGVLTIPAKIRDVLKEEGWKSKDTVWLWYSEEFQCFCVFKDLDGYWSHKQRRKLVEELLKKKSKKKPKS